MEVDLKRFGAWLKRKGRSKSTIASYVNALDLYFRSGYRWTFQDACLWKERAMHDSKPATVNLRVHAINACADFSRVRWRLKPVKVQVQHFVEHQLTTTQMFTPLKAPR